MDKRVIKTKKVIRQALFQLLENKALSQITVTELCQVAKINRRTFYIHYERIKDVMDEYQDQLYLSIITALNQHSQSFSSLMKAFDHNLNEHASELRLMTLNDQSHTIIPQFKLMLVNAFFDGLNAKPTFKNKIIIGYLVTGVLEAYNTYFKAPTPENYHQLRKTNSEVMSALVKLLNNCDIQVIITIPPIYLNELEKESLSTKIFMYFKS